MPLVEAGACGGASEPRLEAGVEHRALGEPVQRERVPRSPEAARPLAGDSVGPLVVLEIGGHLLVERVLLEQCTPYEQGRARHPSRGSALRKRVPRERRAEADQVKCGDAILDLELASRVLYMTVGPDDGGRHRARGRMFVELPHQMIDRAGQQLRVVVEEQNQRTASEAGAERAAAGGAAVPRQAVQLHSFATRAFGR